MPLRRGARSDRSPNDRALPDLEKDVPYLDRLASLRDEAERMLDSGLRALLFPSASFRWDDPPQPTESIEIALLRRAKHLAYRRGTIDDSYVTTLPEIPKLRHEQLLSTVREEVPVFAAANVLRAALDEPGENLNSNTLLSFYWLIRQLHSASSPEWALGAARAGVSGQGSSRVSAFVTSECARSLGFLARKLEQTAELLESVDATWAYAEQVKSATTHTPMRLPKEWCDVELARVSVSLRVTVTAARGNTLVELGPILPNDPWDHICTLVERHAARFASELHSAIISVLRDVDELRTREESSTQPSAPLFDGHPSAWNRRALILSETAHTFARETLRRAQDRLGDLTKQLTLRGVANECRRNATAITYLVRPVKVFAENSMYRAIFDYEEQRVLRDVPQLAFCTATAGELTGNWSDAVYRRAFKILCKALDERGCFPTGRPFHVGTRGYELLPINAQVVRAFAQVMHHVPSAPPLKTVERLLRFFKDGAISGDNSTVAWGRGPGRAFRDVWASNWVTCVSVLALSRITRMLDAKLNERVKAHFTVHVRRDRQPTIDQLMCTDIGLAALPGWPARSGRRTLTKELELLRAHLAGPRCVGITGHEDLYAIILYGPPGTGKTTIIHALANSAKCDVVEVTPSDFVLHGAENLERRATAVMRALALLRESVILFDEFDLVLHSRESQSHLPSSIFDFLTAGMLPKLTLLNSAARKNRSVYALATNYFQRLDEAAVRPGRFDQWVSVLPPDVPSRICRLASEFRRCAMTHTGSAGDVETRAVGIVANTPSVPTVGLCRKGWYTAPSDALVDPSCAWPYLLGQDESAPDWPMPIEIPLLARPATGGDPKQYAPRSELILWHDAETRILQHWNRVALDLFHEDGKLRRPIEWDRFVKLFGADETVSEILKNLRVQLAQLRRERIAERQ